ncbi:MAG: hypothetical protein NVSMB18_22210 [Acetobacteraceae bacterium]
MIRAGALAAWLLACGWTGPAAACERRAEASVGLVEGFPILSASVGATPVSLLLDTGAQGHLLVPEAAQRLQLAPLPGVMTRLFGTGGERTAAVVLLDGVRIGGAPLPAIATPVTDLPGVPIVSPMLAGLLGAPLLDTYDIGLDLAGGRLTLYDAGACAAPPAMGLRTTLVPLEVTPAREAVLSVTVNGQPLLALLDTGSRATLLTEAAARRLGLEGPVSANTARGVDGERLPLRHVRARTMAVGEDVRQDVPVSIAPLQLGRAEMLLGADYLGQRRVWISYATGRIAIALPGLPASGR